MNNDLQQFFSQLNSYFDRIYVLTLRRAGERHEHVKRELVGLDFEFFYGVDKKDLDIPALIREGIYDETQAIRNHRFTKPLLPGMIGCSWSHKNIYKKITNENIGRALILEDDIVINKSQVHFFPAILDQLPQDWELLYLGYARHEETNLLSPLKKLAYHIQRMFGRHKFSHQTIRNLYPAKISEHVFKAGYHDQTHAYAVSRAGAEKLWKLQEPITYIADNLLAYAATTGTVKAYVVKPKLIDQLSQGEVKKTGTYIND